MYPASQNVLVDIRDECANPRMMCASGMVSGIHGMPKLHVWVDLIYLPLGILMRVGLLVLCLFLTGSPSSKKFHGSPESDTACCAALVTRFVLNMVS